MNVAFYDVVTKLPLGNARQVRELHHLLGQSDIVTLHVPETPATQWMIGEAEIAAMKPGSILINASRGTVVRIEPLAAALKQKKLLGAAIDVFPVEPRTNKDEFQSPLRGLDNVILTPHIGGSTMEAQANIGLEVAEKLVKYSDNGTSTFSDNNINISSQYLQTNEKIGYVVTDIDAAYSDMALEKLAKVNGTIRSRVLF
jgi:D-3-phosphoglycerate dehydrogenase